MLGLIDNTPRWLFWRGLLFAIIPRSPDDKLISFLFICTRVFLKLNFNYRMLWLFLGFKIRRSMKRVFWCCDACYTLDKMSMASIWCTKNTIAVDTVAYRNFSWSWLPSCLLQRYISIRKSILLISFTIFIYFYCL